MDGSVLLDFHLETDVLTKALGDDLDVRTLGHFAGLKIQYNRAGVGELHLDVVVASQKRRREATGADVRGRGGCR